MDPEELQSGAAAPETTDHVETHEPENVVDAVRLAVEAQRKGDDAAEGDGEKTAAERARDEQGRFAAKAEKDAAKADETAQQQTDTQQQAPQYRAPVGWTPAAKAEFDRLSPTVKESVTKREAEIDRGFAILAEYKGLEEFGPTLKAAGITHAEFARRAVQWEKDLAARPADTAGHVLSLAARNAGVAPVQMAASLMRSVAQQAGLSPQQVLGLLQQASVQPQAAPQQRPQAAPQLSIEQVRAQISQEFASREINSEVSRFMADPATPHASAVFEDMALLLEGGRATTLKDAYDKACWANPEIRAQLINQQRTTPSPSNGQRQAADVSRAKAADKAVTGAPSGRAMSNPGQRPASASVSDDVRAAYEAALGNA